MTDEKPTPEPISSSEISEPALKYLAPDEYPQVLKHLYADNSKTFQMLNEEHQKAMAALEKYAQKNQEPIDDIAVSFEKGLLHLRCSAACAEIAVKERMLSSPNRDDREAWRLQYLDKAHVFEPLPPKGDNTKYDTSAMKMDHRYNLLDAHKQRYDGTPIMELYYFLSYFPSTLELENQAEKAPRIDAMDEHYDEEGVMIWHEKNILDFNDIIQQELPNLEAYKQLLKMQPSGDAQTRKRLYADQRSAIERLGEFYSAWDAIVDLMGDMHVAVSDVITEGVNVSYEVREKESVQEIPQLTQLALDESLVHLDNAKDPIAYVQQQLEDYFAELPKWVKQEVIAETRDHSAKQMPLLSVDAEHLSQAEYDILVQHQAALEKLEEKLSEEKLAAEAENLEGQYNGLYYSDCAVATIIAIALEEQLRANDPENSEYTPDSFDAEMLCECLLDQGVDDMRFRGSFDENPELLAPCKVIAPHLAELYGHSSHRMQAAGFDGRTVDDVKNLAAAHSNLKETIHDTNLTLSQSGFDENSRIYSIIANGRNSDLQRGQEKLDHAYHCVKDNHTSLREAVEKLDATRDDYCPATQTMIGLAKVHLQVGDSYMSNITQEYERIRAEGEELQADMPELPREVKSVTL